MVPFSLDCEALVSFPDLQGCGSADIGDLLDDLASDSEADTKPTPSPLGPLGPSPTKQTGHNTLSPVATALLGGGVTPFAPSNSGPLQAGCAGLSPTSSPEATDEEFRCFLSDMFPEISEPTAATPTSASAAAAAAGHQGVAASLAGMPHLAAGTYNNSNSSSPVRLLQQQVCALRAGSALLNNTPMGPIPAGFGMPGPLSFLGATGSATAATAGYHPATMLGSINLAPSAAAAGGMQQQHPVAGMQMLPPHSILSSSSNFPVGDPAAFTGQPSAPSLAAAAAAAGATAPVLTAQHSPQGMMPAGPQHGSNSSGSSASSGSSTSSASRGPYMMPGTHGGKTVPPGVLRRLQSTTQALQTPSQPGFLPNTLPLAGAGKLQNLTPTPPTPAVMMMQGGGVLGSASELGFNAGYTTSTAQHSMQQNSLLHPQQQQQLQQGSGSPAVRSAGTKRGAATEGDQGVAKCQRQEPAATAGQQQQQERVSPAAGSVGAKRGNAGALERDERLAKRQARAAAPGGAKGISVCAGPNLNLYGPQLYQQQPMQLQPMQLQPMQQQPTPLLFSIGLHPLQHSMQQLAAQRLLNNSTGINHHHQQQQQQQQQQQRAASGGYTAMLLDDSDGPTLQPSPALGSVAAAGPFPAAASPFPAAAAAAPSAGLAALAGARGGAAAAAAAAPKVIEGKVGFSELGFPSGIFRFTVGSTDVDVKVLGGKYIEWPVLAPGSIKKSTEAYSPLPAFHRAVLKAFPGARGTSANKTATANSTAAWTAVRVGGMPLQMWRDAARQGLPVPEVPPQCIVALAPKPQ